MRIVILSLLVCLLSCTEEIESPLGYPIVTTDIEEVTVGGASFTGIVAHGANSGEIVKYGFVWAEQKNPTLDSFQDWAKGDPGESFSKHVNHDLVFKHGYYVRAFVQTNAMTIYGTELKFVSKGSK